MERIEFNIPGTVNTTPAPTEMSMSVDVTSMDFGSPAAGMASDVVSRALTITGTSGTVAVKIGATDWIAATEVMAGSVTEVSMNGAPYVPVVVGSEVLLGDFGEGVYALSLKVTPPIDIDLNTYNQTVVVIGE